jgi:hypothetical protein
VIRWIEQFEPVDADQAIVVSVRETHSRSQSEADLACGTYLDQEIGGGERKGYKPLQLATHKNVPRLLPCRYHHIYQSV